jgi:hypothetical protein
MATRNTALRNALADAHAAIYNSGAILFYTGSRPADPNNAMAGTLLATMTLPATAFGAASAGAAAKAGTWSATVTTSGTCGAARMRNSGNTQWQDIRVRKTADSDTGEELVFDNNAFVQDGTITITAFTLTAPVGTA